MNTPQDNRGSSERRRSRPPSAAACSSSSRSHRKGETRNGRVSRARKSLNFDAQPGPSSSTASFYPPFDEEASFPHGIGDQYGNLEDAAHETFWSNPPPPPPNSGLPVLDLPFSKDHHRQRRSPRLIGKTEVPPKQKDATKILNASVVSDDSGYGPTPPSSQTFPGSDLTPSKCKKPNGDSASVASSDYGTFSEDSCGVAMQSKLRSRTSRLGDVPDSSSSKSISQQHRLPLSPGYLSDIDEQASPPSPENFLNLGPQPWDDEEPTPQQKVESPSDVVLNEAKGLEGIWVDNGSNPSNINSSSYLRISNLSAADDVGVKWLSNNGVHIVIPLQGLQLPPNLPEMRNSNLQVSPPIPPRRKRLRLNLPREEPKSPFYISTRNETLTLQDAFLRHGLRIVGASDTVTPQPMGTKFCALYPAIISIPLTQIPAAGDKVYCLQSETHREFNVDENPCDSWTFVEDSDISFQGGRIIFETYEFRSYVIVIREAGIEAQKQIRTRIGGKLIVPEVPWIEIEFPRGSLKEDITAKAHVFLDTEQNVGEFLRSKGHNPVDALPLASPIVMLEPHGFDFLPDLVRVDLPIPNYNEILELFGPTAQLQVWQSCTGHDEEAAWERIDANLSLRRVRHVGNQVQMIASFTVSHFSFFKVVWDLISASLYEARVGMSYFHSFVSFSMKCQANMEEAETAEEGSRFGLEVICFRSDKKLPEHTNYRYKVGASMKPKLVRPGKIFVRLKSSYFEADEDAGEDPELVKEEADFRGRDFEVQYCCKFKPDKRIDRGPFGKVIVNRQNGGKSGEKLFEFNLQKSGHEGEQTPGGGDERWSIVALQELATGLFILDGDNWKVFAQHIGFTKQEIKKHFKNSENPFMAMVNIYQHRGGTPDEFVKALYTVNRELKVPAGTSPCPSLQSRSSTGSSGRGSMTTRDNYQGIGGIGSDSDTSGTQTSQDSGLAEAGPSKKRSNPSLSRGVACSKPKRPRNRTPVAAGDEGDEESSDSLDMKMPGSVSDPDEENDRVGVLGKTARSETNASSVNRRNDATKLEQSYLWEISAYMEHIMGWKSLGRTLWLEEHALINIEATHRQGGTRELFFQVLLSWKEKHPKRCTFGTLYSALRKEGMNGVAKAMMSIQRNN